MTDTERASITANLIIAAIILAIVAGMTVWFVTVWSEPEVPRCTHEIANAGGICQGGDPI